MPDNAYEKILNMLDGQLLAHTRAYYRFVMAFIAFSIICLACTAALCWQISSMKSQISYVSRENARVKQQMLESRVSMDLRLTQEKPRGKPETEMP